MATATVLMLEKAPSKDSCEIFLSLLTALKIVAITAVPVLCEISKTITLQLSLFSRCYKVKTAAAAFGQVDFRCCFDLLLLLFLLVFFLFQLLMV